MSFGSWLKKTFKSAGDGIKKAANSVKNAASNAVNSIYNVAKPIVNTVYNDLISVPKFIGRQIDKETSAITGVISKAPDVIDHGITGVTSIGTGFANALPYAAGAAVVGVLGYTYMNSGGGKRSNSQFSREFIKRRKFM